MVYASLLSLVYKLCHLLPLLRFLRNITLLQGATIKNQGIRTLQAYILREHHVPIRP